MMLKQSGNLKDVAAKAGVSLASVSYAMRGKTGVSEEKRKKILRIANELGYQPSAAARILKSKKINDIGFLMLGMTNVKFPALQNSFSSVYLIPFIRICNELDIHYQIEHFQCTKGSEELPRILTSGLIGGLIVVGYPGAFLDRYLQERFELPTVNLLEKGEYSVELNAEQGIRDLVCHLNERGHRRIALINNWTVFAAHSSAYRGYRAGLEQCGIPFDESIYHEVSIGLEYGESVHETLQHIYHSNSPDSPTAIISPGENFTRSLISYLNRHQIRVPEDVSVFMYFENLESGTLFHPKISALAVSSDIIPVTVQLLRSLMDGETPSQNNILTNMKIIGRETDLPLN